MPERTILVHDGDLLLELLQYAERTEEAAEVKGTWQGMPCMAIVVVGANVGLLEKYARAGTLMLTPLKKSAERDIA